MTNPAPADDITLPAMPAPDLGGEITTTAAMAMDALRAALKSDPEYAWSWHCAIWSGAHDEGLETGAANRAAARVMHMAFGIDTSKHKNFQPSHHATVPAAVDVGAAQAETAQAAPLVERKTQSVSDNAACGEPTLRIYADGGCSPNPGAGGWGFCCDGYEDFGGDLETTNNRMEMTAIIKAMEWAMQAGAAGPRRFSIHSDSQLCVNTLTKWAQGWERKGWNRKKNGAIANLDLVQRAYELYKKSGVSVHWIRGHAGNAGNERADQLAGDGRRMAMRLAATPGATHGN